MKKIDVKYLAKLAKLKGFFIGKVMQKIKGRADTKEAVRIISNYE